MDAVLVREGGGLSFERVPDPVPGWGEVVIELRAAALNHRDLHVRTGFYQDITYPFVPGSDGAGVRRNTREEVVIFPSLAWGTRQDAPGPNFRILGGPDDGTHAELVKVPVENVFPKPARLSWEEAAALPLAGLTAYRALFSRARLRRGETVLVQGIGGGVAAFALLLARAAGARVIVTSSSAAKVERACELGAAAGVLYTAHGWPAEVRALSGGTGVDVVLDAVGSTWADSLHCLRPGGRLVAFGGAQRDEARLEVRPFYFGQYSLIGTTMGSPRDFARLLARVERGRWAPMIDSVRPLAEIADAHARMERGRQFGKLVLRVS